MKAQASLQLNPTYKSITFFVFSFFSFFKQSLCTKLFRFEKRRASPKSTDEQPGEGSLPGLGQPPLLEIEHITSYWV